MTCFFLFSPASKRFPISFIKSCLYVPPTQTGLHHLHGPAVQLVGLRDCVHSGWRPGRHARRRGQIHQVWTHAAHALHAGDVQQWHKGMQLTMHQRATTHSQHNQKLTAHSSKDSKPRNPSLREVLLLLAKYLPADRRTHARAPLSRPNHPTTQESH